MHFKRPKLALDIVNELLGKVPMSDAPNGLFLAAPRRTGKTEFLRFDLVPALQDSNVLVAYVDLWADLARSPSDLIAQALINLAIETDGLVAQIVKGTGLDSITFAGIKIDISKIGKTGGLTLFEMLALLRKKSGKKIALIIDEAQHALTSEEGSAAMSALKSARDQMRDQQGSNLLLVMSGSHRDKLLQLLNTAAAPFWGSQVRGLPTLGQPFVDHVCADIQLATGEVLNKELMLNAFKLSGERPQFFKATIREAQNNQGITQAPTHKLEQRVVETAERLRQHDRDGMASVYKALSPLEKAILWRMLDQASDFKAFDAKALAFYGRQTDKSVNAAQAQKAMDKLRQNNPPIVWKSLRGEYSIYDSGMQDWYAYLIGQMAWPPG